MQSAMEGVKGKKVLVLKSQNQNFEASLLCQLLNKYHIRHVEKQLLSSDSLPSGFEEELDSTAAVLLLDIAAPEAVRSLADVAYNKNVPVVACGKSGGKLVVTSSLGPNVRYPAVSCGLLSLSGVTIHVGSAVVNKDQVTVTCDGVHNVDGGDTVEVGGARHTVVSVLSDHVFTLSHDTNASGTTIKQGAEVLIAKKSSWPASSPPIKVADGLESLEAADLDDDEVGGLLVHQFVVVLLAPGLVNLNLTRNMCDTATDVNIEKQRVLLVGERESELTSTLEKVCSDVAVLEVVDVISSLTSANSLEMDTPDLVMCSAAASSDFRRSLGDRCVGLRKPLVVLGQTGLSGYLETHVPDKTVSYTCLPDPVDKEYPHCVIKSFPHTGHQALIWSMNKLESYTLKLEARNNFVKEHRDKLSDLGQQLASGSIPEGARETQFFNLNFGVTPTWQDCVRVSRQKLEKYFVNKALQLCSVFPQDTRLRDDTLFWSWPKLLPVPVTWDWSPGQHTETVLELARYFAYLLQVEVENDKHLDISAVSVGKFEPKNKTIVTDETASKQQSQVLGSLDLSGLCEYVDRVNIQEPRSVEESDLKQMKHDLAVKLCNLRCDMYRIPRPVPGDLTTWLSPAASCFSPVSHQLAALAKRAIRDVLTGRECKNSWISSCGHLVTVPALPPAFTTITQDIKTSIWTVWEVQGDDKMTLQNFIQIFLDKYSVKVSLVVQDSRMIYMSMMPTHKARLGKPMSSLVKNPGGDRCVHLTLMAASITGQGDDLALPKVKYIF